MPHMRSSLAAVVLSSLLVWPAAADIKVVASIKPVHSLVAGVMAGVGEPTLIVEGAGSPHTYSLKPSRAQALQDADVIFWIGHNLEPFLEKPLESLGGNATVVELMDTEGLTMVALREGGAFEGHGHDEHGHDDHKDEAKHDDHEEHGHKDEAKHDDHEEHGHKDEAKHDDHEEHGHKDEAKHDDDHDAHGSEEVDVHIWLDPVNAKVLTSEIARKLAAVDPENAARYAANAKAMTTRIDGLSESVSAVLEPVHDRPFVVFHDAYQHFETRFDLNAVGSITVSPEVVPGAARIEEIRAKILELNAACVFSEPQFTPKLVTVVSEGTSARQGVLDPLGADLTPGPDLYFSLIENLGANMAACLARPS